MVTRHMDKYGQRISVGDTLISADGSEIRVFYHQRKSKAVVAEREVDLHTGNSTSLALFLLSGEVTVKEKM